MYDVSTQLYHKVAELLLEDIGDDGYYYSDIDFCHDGIDCSLSLSAVIYRQRIESPDKSELIISDIIPVWWEFHTYDEGSEILNTFSFNELRKIIKS